MKRRAARQAEMEAGTATLAAVSDYGALVLVGIVDFVRNSVGTTGQVGK